MRVEFKYKSNYLELRRIILKLQMTKKISDRIINSIYFDDYKKTNYVDSMEGTVPRQKIRFRWYGSKKINDLPKGTIEIKKTFANSRDKKLFKVDNFNLILIKKNISKFMPSLIKPICQVTYYREYFENHKGHRMTLDTDLKYFRLDNICNIEKLFVDYTKIAELKLSKYSDYEKISSSFENLRVRNSKYCNAIENLYL